MVGLDLGWFSNSRSLIGLISLSDLIGSNWKPFIDSGRVGLREVESGTVPRTPTNTKTNISRDKFASLAARYSDDSEDIGGDRGKKGVVVHFYHDFERSFSEYRPLFENVTKPRIS